MSHVISDSISAASAELAGGAGVRENVARWVVDHYQVSLALDPLVFKPTLTTSLLVQCALKVGVRGKSVLDLGCGTGPIAIALALAGAEPIVATDLMPRACALARANAVRNGVGSKIMVCEGDLFEPVAGRKFDLIVDDVSGVAEEVAKISRWFPPDVPLGGRDGTSLTIDMLRCAPGFLRPGGRLLFPVLSLSNAPKIVTAAKNVFGDRLQLLGAKKIPFNQELKDNLDALSKLRDAGIIHFDQIRSRLLWTLEIYSGMVS